VALWAGFRNGSGERLARPQRGTTGKHLDFELKMSYLHSNALADGIDMTILNYRRCGTVCMGHGC